MRMIASSRWQSPTSIAPRRSNAHKAAGGLSELSQRFHAPQTRMLGICKLSVQIHATKYLATARIFPLATSSF
jgi:hypothetical protein